MTDTESEARAAAHRANREGGGEIRGTVTDTDDLLAELRGEAAGPQGGPENGPWTPVRVPTLLAAAREIDRLRAEVERLQARAEEYRSEGIAKVHEMRDRRDASEAEVERLQAENEMQQGIIDGLQHIVDGLSAGAASSTPTETDD